MFTQILGVSSWRQPYHILEITQQNIWSLYTWVIFGLVLLAPLKPSGGTEPEVCVTRVRLYCAACPLWMAISVKIGHLKMGYVSVVKSGLLQNPPFSSIFCPMNTFIYSGFSGPSCPSGLRFWQQRPTRLSQTLGSSYKGGWSGRILEIFWRCVGIIIITLR